MLDASIAWRETVEDPRRGWKVEHRPPDIPAIAVRAVLGEAESFEDVALYGRSRRARGGASSRSHRHRFGDGQRRRCIVVHHMSFAGDDTLSSLHSFVGGGKGAGSRRCCMDMPSFWVCSALSNAQFPLALELA